jgi:DNA-binding LytR/AlgR family response regulator
MKCIAIDDEPIALNILREYCERRGNIELRTFSSPSVGMRKVLESKPDLVFLDIEMNGISGLEFAKHLPDTTCLIFTTAYAEYALDGYEVNAVDFLHKPFFYERFERAMEKAEMWVQYRDMQRGSVGPGRQIIVKSDYRNVPVPVEKIEYVESIDNYVKIHMLEGNDVVSKMPLHSLEQILPEEGFVRIHRSYIVPVGRIESFTRAEVELADGKIFPIGKTYLEDVIRAISK